MNTQRSEEKAELFLKRPHHFNRKRHTAIKRFSFSPEHVFFQLCPSRELDWIDGWDCDLVYTSDGFMESDCIWTTPETNVFGSGLWVVTRYQPNRKLEFIRLIDDTVVEHVRIHLADNQDGTTTGEWRLTFTALNERGSDVVAAMPDAHPELEQALDGLENFLSARESKAT